MHSAKDKELFAKKNKAYLVSATKRSGHHAVIYWLLAHDENMMFLNHIRKINRCQYLIKLKQNSKYDYVINFENEVMKFNLDEQIETKYEIKRIGVVRSFRNWLASLMKIKSTKTFKKQLTSFMKIRPKRADNNIERLRELCEIWIKLADHFFNDERYYLIYFDEWFVNQNYRKKISNELGLKFTDKNINFVPPNGRGSSFDERFYDGEGQKMNVLRRYEEIAGETFYGMYLQLCSEYEHRCKKEFY